MTLNRKPAIDAVRDYMRRNQTNALQNNVIWMNVQIALNAIEDALEHGTADTGQLWVITRHGHPLVVCRNKRKAKRRLRLIRQLSAQPDREGYAITAVEVERP